MRTCLAFFCGVQYASLFTHVSAITAGELKVELMPEVKLVVVGGEANAEEYTLHLPTVIGRCRDADILLSHPLVSRRHCRLSLVNDELVVEDLGSLNGTFVGREPVTRAVLPPGELLTIGAVTFRAIYNDWREGDSDMLHRENACVLDDPCARGEETQRVDADQTMLHPDLERTESLGSGLVDLADNDTEETAAAGEGGVASRKAFP